MKRKWATSSTAYSSRSSGLLKRINCRKSRDKRTNWKTNWRRISKTPATNVKRPVNLDPGYIEQAKVILASTKNFYHRIYLGRGHLRGSHDAFQKQHVSVFSLDVSGLPIEGLSGVLPEDAADFSIAASHDVHLDQRIAWNNHESNRSGEPLFRLVEPNKILIRGYRVQDLMAHCSVRRHYLSDIQRRTADGERRPDDRDDRRVEHRSLVPGAFDRCHAIRGVGGSAASSIGGGRHHLFRRSPWRRNRAVLRTSTGCREDRRARPASSAIFVRESSGSPASGIRWHDRIHAPEPSLLKPGSGKSQDPMLR